MASEESTPAPAPGTEGGQAPHELVEVIDTLEAGGWVARTPDPSDGRATLLSLTPSGRDLLARVAQARDRGAEGVLGGLSPQERATLTEALTPLTTPDPQA